MAGKPKKPPLTAEQLKVVENMARVGMPQKYMAIALGMGETTFKRMRAENPELNSLLLKSKTDGNNAVLNKAWEMAVSGDHPAMTIFWLKCRLKWSPQTDVPSESIDTDPVDD